ncbi:MAG: DUF4923 family protein [Muribaculaceae bacterium]|nr:DUF4923 family protein [Muribaculaceae bacterium]
MKRYRIYATLWTLVLAAAFTLGAAAADSNGIIGSWKYQKPCVEADGTSLVGKVGKPIAKKKLSKKIDKAFKKIKLDKRWQSFTLNSDDTWEMVILRQKLTGSYSYDPDTESLVLKFYGVPVRGHAWSKGDRLYVTFDADKLIAVLGFIGGISHSDSLKEIDKLIDNYVNVRVGFEFKRLVSEV